MGIVSRTETKLGEDVIESFERDRFDEAGVRLEHDALVLQS